MINWLPSASLAIAILSLSAGTLIAQEAPIKAAQEIRVSWLYDEKPRKQTPSSGESSKVQGKESAKDKDKSSSAKNRAFEINRYSLTPIQSISLSTASEGELSPKDLAGEVFTNQQTEFHAYGFSRASFMPSKRWTATGIFHRPLYFEDCSLELCGRDHGCLEPIVSAAKFYGRIAVWPYMIGATCPNQCQYSDGRCHAADCSPHFFRLPKPSLRGALYQTAAVTGAVFLIP